MECSICFECLLNPPNFVGPPVKTECGHIYHRDCLEKWLKVRPRSRKCPACRTVVAERNITTMRIISRKSRNNEPVGAIQSQNGCFNSEEHEKMILEYETRKKQYETLKEEVALKCGLRESLEILDKELQKSKMEAKDKLKSAEKRITERSGDDSDDSDDEDESDSSGTEMPKQNKRKKGSWW